MKHTKRTKRTIREFLVWPSLSFMLVVAVVIGLIIWKELAPDTPKLPEPPLKELAARQNITIGNYAALKLFKDKAFADILTKQFEFATVDGELNWTFNDGTLRPSFNKFDFTNPDKVFAFARHHHMPTQAHHFVWGEEKWIPDWLKNGRFSSQQLLDFIHEHIQTVGGHYKGQVREWTVVNEAFSRKQHIYGLKDWWADAIGNDSYIDQSFIWARQADPNAKLLMNDFNNETEGPVSNAMYTYIKGMQERGVPIDGIGMQMHLDGTRPPSKAAVIKNMQRFGALGIKVYITELDVNLNDLKGTQEQRLQIEAKMYREMAEACIESKVCPSLGLLGITDKDSWYSEMGLKQPDALIFDRHYRPKPAFYGLRAGLE